ncbi:hypothetical protein I546_4480 [Mycobacterium kansasii 732]|nr:hypothetical protein I546_4480 [Mycobacterium kansasii 732]KZS70123.1 hypothetical protein A4G27_21355 [Mycobacterium kansasii]
MQVRPEQAEQHQEHAVEDGFEVAGQRHPGVLHHRPSESGEQTDQEQHQPEGEQQCLHSKTLSTRGCS